MIQPADYPTLEILEVFYEEASGVVYDEFGGWIDILTYIRPDQWDLFKADPGHNVFDHMKNPRCSVIINGMPQEEGWYDGGPEDFGRGSNLPLCYGAGCWFSSWDKDDRGEICRACAANYRDD